MATRNWSENIHTLKAKLAEADHVAVLTGAGISAESGVPTFRGEDGLWRQYRAVDLATPAAFAQDPKLVWEFYHWRRELLASLQPNVAHRALAELEQQVPEFTLITQNIDDLHRLAGSRNIIELHGNIWRVQCIGCSKVEEDRRVPLPELPHCTGCGSLLRPAVVWFGEPLDPLILEQTYKALSICRVLLVIGTSGVVQPAASMGSWAKRHGAFVAEINLEPTPYNDVYDLCLQGKAGDIVPQLLSTKNITKPD